MLEQLRVSTREQHRTLDAALSRYDLTDRSRYEDFLRIHLYSLTELQSRWRTEDDAEFAHLLSMLENDLGCRTAAATESWRSRTQESAPAQAIGISYVIRGSRLGAALLRRRVPEDFPTEYLSAQLGLSWRAFLEQLESFARSANPMETVIAVNGAISAFGVFGRNLQKQQAHE
jgi:heme oxygenase